MMNFWEKLPRPILALAPMDGVTDAPFRAIVAKYGKPDLIFTEFVNVEGLARNAAVMLDDFLYSETERPILAQIYGSEPESFYKIAVLVCALGFDGIDINMGCPAKNVAARGCGAALIKNPPLAKAIIQAVKRGVQDWVNGITLADLGLKPRMALKVAKMNELRWGPGREAPRHVLPVSVKTRIGYDSVVIEDWVQHLLEEEPVAISIHGRTLKQMYTGQADWEAIGRAAEVIHRTKTLVLGNGDLTHPEAVVEKLRLSGVDGVLIGRGAQGNPWLFRAKERIRKFLQDGVAPMGPWTEEPSLEARFAVLLEHSRLFEATMARKRFPGMRKHFANYCRGIPRAAELRGKMFQTQNSDEVEAVLNEYLARKPDLDLGLDLPPSDRIDERAQDSL